MLHLDSDLAWWQQRWLPYKHYTFPYLSNISLNVDKEKDEIKRNLHLKHTIINHPQKKCLIILIVLLKCSLKANEMKSMFKYVKHAQGIFSTPTVDWDVLRDGLPGPSTWAPVSKRGTLRGWPPGCKNHSKPVHMGTRDCSTVILIVFQEKVV